MASPASSMNRSQLPSQVRRSLTAGTALVQADVVALMDCINSFRPKLWCKRLPRRERREAILDVEGLDMVQFGGGDYSVSIIHKKQGF